MEERVNVSELLKDCSQGMSMNQEDKSLLLKDLCGRLPHGVFVNINGIKCILQPHDISDFIKCDIDIKPYLFPLSSMTEEQKRELKDLISQETKILIEQFKNDDCDIDKGKYHFINNLELDWLLKNHFDYRGLIKKSLALDATNLNIYRI